ncbi:MAG: 16S rRNA (guanine(966)-N(2))-methyltransferase RsmD [Firmicutes bacterium]|nr:16S rRNA (guanine(966)-N(2))-methyltransferase RsmD [Bacillota bacterium]
MRVISGKFKGRKLFSPNGDRVRPTADRIKESIFNILTSKDALDGVLVLDLFCGTGGLGIEALSRGAKKIVFADIDLESLEFTKKNLQHINAELSEYEIYHADYTLALKKLEGKNFDLIILDPPYGKNYFDCLILISELKILSENGFIVFEYSDKLCLQNFENEYIIETRNMGNTKVSFLSLR